MSASCTAGPSVLVLVLMQVALDSVVSGKDCDEDNDQRLSSVERDYFERCVAVISASQKLTDNATMLTRAAQSYQHGTFSH